MSSSQKKRKSEVHLENAGVQPSKKEKPWYQNEENDLSSSRSKVPEREEKGRRTSFLGGLLKKMKSSSTLKERNRSASTSKLSFLPKNSDDKLSTSQAPSEASDASFISDSSMDSLPIQFHKNADLARFVENASMNSSDTDDISYSNTSASSSSQYGGSALSLCTPLRGGSDFHRGQLRSSVRSMPGGELLDSSSLVNGLCNSAVRRNSSSASADRSPAAFLRRKSVRLIGKMGAGAGSLADLPEDFDANQSFAPLAEVDDESDSPSSTAHQLKGAESSDAVTPLAAEADQRRNENRLSWVKRSHSRIFSSSSRKSRGQSTSEGAEEGLEDGSVSMIVEPCSLLDTTAVTPTNRTFCGASGSGFAGSMTLGAGGGSGLRKTTPSSSSLQKRVSSALRKGLGLRGSSSNMTPPTVLVADKLKRTKTSKTAGRPPICPVVRRGTDVTSVGSSRAILEAQNAELTEKLREAKLFLAKTSVSDQMVMETLASGQVDSVALDLLLNGKPVSPMAGTILEHYGIGDELHRSVMSNPAYQKIQHIEDKPSVVFVKLDHTLELARRVRTGIGMALRQVFAEERTRRVLLYPMFCYNEAEWDSPDACVDQLLMIVMKSLGWNTSPDTFDCAVIAGVTPENVELIKTRYQLFLEREVYPVIHQGEELERKKREAEQATADALVQDTLPEDGSQQQEDDVIMAASASETLV